MTGRSLTSPSFKTNRKSRTQKSKSAITKTLTYTYPILSQLCFASFVRVSERGAWSAWFAFSEDWLASLTFDASLTRTMLQVLSLHKLTNTASVSLICFRSPLTISSLFFSLMHFARSLTAFHCLTCRLDSLLTLPSSARIYQQCLLGYA